MYPALTYELRITLKSDLKLSQKRELKEKIFAVLRREGIESFVEGVVDAIDLDFEYGLNQADQYEQHGGESSPISVYKYSLELLEDLKVKLHAELGEDLVLAMHSSPTQEWMDGWKDSFKPIITKHLYVYPPWETVDASVKQIPVVIEPGMAFGTGQHATTQLCLEKLEQIHDQKLLATRPTMLDVGTGTGILAIAAVKLCQAELVATDIDVDAIMAARANAAANNVAISYRETSLPSDPQGDVTEFDLIFANILFVVLKDMVADLSRFLKPGGHLLLSGLLEEDGDRMRQICEGAGLKFASQSVREGWLCLHARRPA